MLQLIATFKVELTSYLLISRTDDDELSCQFPIDDYLITIRFPEDSDFRHKEKDQTDFTFGVSKILVAVAREEHENVPPVLITGEGHKDYSPQAPYFEERLPKYQGIAVEAINRVIHFFKYHLRQPLLHEVTLRDQSLQNPEWTDETGNLVGKDRVMFIVQPVPGLHPIVFGSQVLMKASDGTLHDALLKRKAIGLYDELLSEAQASAVQGKIRRAILEIAIACEVAVKHTFFAPLTTAGAAYEYLESKRYVNIRVLELIDGTAKYTFGESFRELYKEDYQNIDYLFRCRNKIAHRGEAIFRDDKGNLQNADRLVLQRWWDSVSLLFEWLDKYR